MGERDEQAALRLWRGYAQPGKPNLGWDAFLAGWEARRFYAEVPVVTLKSFPSSPRNDGPEGDDRNRTGGGVRS